MRKCSRMTVLNVQSLKRYSTWIFFLKNKITRWWTLINLRINKKSNQTKKLLKNEKVLVNAKIKIEMNLNIYCVPQYKQWKCQKRILKKKVCEVKRRYVKLKQFKTTICLSISRWYTRKPKWLGEGEVNICQAIIFNRA